jgi:plastocyanin
VKRLSTVLTVAAVAVAGLVPALAAGPAAGRTTTTKTPRKTIKIGDNFYAPTKVTVNAGTLVTWKWPAVTGDTHDVKLGKGPKGAKKFHSAEAGSDYSFSRKLTVPGTYKIICTLHADMRATIIVRKKR